MTLDSTGVTEPAVTGALQAVTARPYASPLAEYAYDGQSRRIRKDTYLGGVLDNVEHFYCIAGSLVETRNGSDQVTQQHVWDNLAPGSGHYIDSLAQVSNNANPGGDDDGAMAGVQDLCDDDYYALQDQQFNVLAIADDQGEIVERYEYALYGQRLIFTPNRMSMRVSGYNMNCGFQGLYHDAESALIYNRARMLDPITGRFTQRDPHPDIYPDGMNGYAAYHVLRGGLDPWGLKDLSNDSHVQIESDWGSGDTNEGHAEDLADATGINKHDNNSYTDIDEIRETMQTAGNDDIVVTMTHVRHPQLGNPTPQKPGISDGLAIDGGDTKYLTKDIIDDINQSKGSPSAIIFLGCDTRQVAIDVQKGTKVRVTIGIARTVTDKEISTADGAKLLDLLNEQLNREFPSRKGGTNQLSLEIAVKFANSRYRKYRKDEGLSVDDAPQLFVYGSDKDCDMSLKELRQDHVNNP